LYLIDYLVTNHGTDPKITKLLDTRTFYILPRVNPDGAEKYLTSQHDHMLGDQQPGGVRQYPDYHPQRGGNRPPGRRYPNSTYQGNPKRMETRQWRRSRHESCHPEHHKIRGGEEV
jgi:hypothetical protein